MVSKQSTRVTTQKQDKPDGNPMYTGDSSRPFGATYSRRVSTVGVLNQSVGI